MYKDKKLIITLCASADSYGAMSENEEGIYASGDTLDEVKENVLKAIQLMKEEWPEADWPQAIRENWPIEWRYPVHKVTPLSELVNEIWGLPGTPKRDEMEQRLKEELKKASTR